MHVCTYIRKRVQKHITYVCALAHNAVESVCNPDPILTPPVYKHAHTHSCYAFRVPVVHAAVHIHRYVHTPTSRPTTHTTHKQFSAWRVFSYKSPREGCGSWRQGSCRHISFSWPQCQRRSKQHTGPATACPCHGSWRYPPSTPSRSSLSDWRGLQTPESQY